MAYFKIFDLDGKLRDTVPYVADCGNKGLPDWFFQCHYIEFLIDEAADTVSWVPGCGPAPCWDRKLSEFEGDADMFKSFKEWADRVYS